MKCQLLQAIHFNTFDASPMPFVVKTEQWIASMRKNNLSAALALVAASAMLVASAACAQPEGKPVSGGAISRGVATEPSCFDPHRSSQQAAFFVARDYIDSLIGKKTDGSFAPWLATEWSISLDGKEYSYNA
jgi:peptide/nickel transport system substrate-binding protein